MCLLSSSSTHTTNKLKKNRTDKAIHAPDIPLLYMIELKTSCKQITYYCADYVVGVPVIPGTCGKQFHFLIIVIE